MARFLQKYATPYFEKVLIARNKTGQDLPKYGGNLQGKRDMCMHHIIENSVKPNLDLYQCTSKGNGFTVCGKCMHSASTKYGINLEAWGIRHSVKFSSRGKSQEGELTAVNWRHQMALWNGKASSGSVTVGSVGECWKTTPPMEFCGRNTSRNKLMGRNLWREVATCANQTRRDGTSTQGEKNKRSA